MPRTKEFSETVALNQAMDVFWAKGYEATSLQDLIAAMEISKSSFYETFGSKLELFASVIENYTNKVASGSVALLDGEPSGRAAVEKMLRVILECSCEEVKRGCLLCNCAVEMAQRDPVSAGHMARGMKQIEDAYCRAIERGQKADGIPAEHDARALARFFVNTGIGLQVWSKGGASRAALTDVVNAALLTLR